MQRAAEGESAVEELKGWLIRVRVVGLREDGEEVGNNRIWPHSSLLVRKVRWESIGNMRRETSGNEITTRQTEG